MAVARSREVIVPVTAQTINSAATYTSAEQDIGADTVALQIFLYLDVAGFAAAPTGQMEVTIAPVHTAAGTVYSDQAVTWAFAVAADQAYAFAIPVCSLPRYFKALTKNNTDQHTDANAVSLRIEYIAETV